MDGDTEKKSTEFDVEVADATSVLANDPTETPTSTLTDDATAKEASSDSVPAISSYQIKPTLHDKFKANPVKEVIRTVLSETLTGETYDTANAKKWTITIANEINTKVKELKMKRYKHIAQVIIGELKGAGVKCGVRCLWDCETDGYTSDIFINDTIFCVAVVFAVYLY